MRLWLAAALVLGGLVWAGLEATPAARRFHLHAPRATAPRPPEPAPAAALAPPAPPGPCRLVALVVDNRGGSLAGAEVEVSDAAGAGWVAKGVTSRSGEVALESLPEGPVRVEVSLDGYAPATVRTDLPWSGTLRVPLSRASRLAVAVEAEGAPLAGATVMVRPGGDVGVTGADGVVLFEDLPGSSVEIEAEAPGRVSVSEERLLPEGGELRVSLSLPAAAPIHGVVLLPDGGPAPGAQVEALADPSMRGADEVATAGEDGSFTMGGLVAASYSLVASAEGEASSAPLEVTAPAGNVILRLREGARVVARLELSHGGSPGEVRVDGRPQPAGRLDVTGLSPGHASLMVEGKGFAPRALDLDLSAGEVRDLGTLVLAEGGRIEGTLEGPSGPLPGSVRLVRLGLPGAAESAAPAGPEGFAFADLAPGRYRLEGSAPDLAPARAEVAVEAGRTAVVALRAGTGAQILGTVLAAPGIPAADARVTITDAATGEAVLHTAARPDGRFASGPLQPGSYVLFVDGAGTERVELGTSDVDRTIGPPADGGMVAGVLRLAGGPPLRRAELVLLEGSARAPADASSLLAALGSPGALLAEPRGDGGFGFEHVRPGPHTLLVLLDGPGPSQARALSVPVVAGADAVELEVEVPRELSPFDVP